MEGVSVVVASAGAKLESDALSFVTGVGDGAVVLVKSAVVAGEVSGGVVAELTTGLAADEELSAEADSSFDVDVEAPSTSGVDVELTKGGSLEIYEPSDCTA
jgi:hypothetical protein